MQVPGGKMCLYACWSWQPAHDKRRRLEHILYWCVPAALEAWLQRACAYIACPYLLRPKILRIYRKRLMKSRYRERLPIKASLVVCSSSPVAVAYSTMAFIFCVS